MKISKDLLIKLGIGTLALSLASAFAIGESKLQAQEPNGNTTIEEIEEEPSDAIGEQVTVRGEISEVQSGVSFTITEEGFLEGDEVLVINVSDEMLPVIPEEELELQVTGEVGEFVYADVDSLYDLDLEPDFYVDYENEPVIFATSVTLSPSLDKIADNPDNYYSQEVAVEGEVQEMKGDFAFILSGDELIDDDNLLVLNATGEPVPEPEAEVVVTGMVRPFVTAELERDYDLTWDLDVQEELEAEYSQQPVLVVDSIYPAEDEGLLD